jgi:DNA-binding Lrp family transcriptional regulator
VADEKDFQLLVRLARDPFASLEKIGRPLGLSGSSVKARLERLRQEGVLPGTWAVPVAEVFRRHSRVFLFEHVEQPTHAIEVAIKTDPVVWAGVDRDRSFHIHMYAISPEDGPPASLVKLLWEPAYSASPLFSTPREGAPVLSPLDWRILVVLVRRPRTQVQEIAKLTGLSPKTVRRRRDEMFHAGLVSSPLVIQGAQSRGLLLYNAYVQGPAMTAEDRHRILSALPRCLLVNTTDRPPGVWLICRARSMAEVLEDEERVKGFPGMTRAGLIIRIREEFAVDRVEGWCREQLAVWEAARRPEGPAKKDV